MREQPIATLSTQRIILTAIGILLLAALAFFTIFPGFWNRASQWIEDRTPFSLGRLDETPFRLGLDLQGGTHLIYEAKMDEIVEADREEALAGVKDVIERRVNAFGVAEPVVQTTIENGHFRVVVELTGVLDAAEAVRLIGETPILEFRELNPNPPTEPNDTQQSIIDAANALEKERGVPEEEWTTFEDLTSYQEALWLNTVLSGRHLKRAQVNFDSQTNIPIILLQFNSEGDELFAEITEANVGQPLAIFLDGALLTAPTVQEKITGGEATITGSFTLEEARLLAKRLNAGALPVPLELISEQTVGPTLGRISLRQSLVAGLIGFALVAIFMIVFYRLPGLLAVKALVLYVGLNLMLWKWLDVTLTLSAVAGFILSIGMAVDANVLIFARLKEEIESGRDLPSSVELAVRRAWSSIRDGNITTLIATAILFYFSTSFIKGFSLTLSIGVILSMFSAVVLTKTYLRIVSRWRFFRHRWLYAVHSDH